MGIPEKAHHGQGNDGIGSRDVVLSHESQHRSRNQEDRGSSQPRGKRPGHPRPPPRTGNQESFAGGTSALFTPFRRCFDRFLGRRPRHAAALRPPRQNERRGVSDQLRLCSRDVARELVMHQTIKSSKQSTCPEKYCPFRSPIASAATAGFRDDATSLRRCRCRNSWY